MESDETYHGKREIPVMSAQRKGDPFTQGGKSGDAQKRPIVALAERGDEARSTQMNHLRGKNVREFLVKNADRKSRLHTGESKYYIQANVGVNDETRMIRFLAQIEGESVTYRWFNKANHA